MTALVVGHTPASSRVLDIPSPLSPSSFCVRVSVSVRRCYRFSGLYAFHSSDSVAVGIRRPRIVVLMTYKAITSSTHALLQCAGHWGCHIRSKSTSENDTGGRGQTRSRIPSALLMVRLLIVRDYRAPSLSLEVLCTVLSVTLTVLRGVGDSPSICIAYETIISPVTILGLWRKVY